MSVTSCPIVNEFMRLLRNIWDFLGNLLGYLGYTWNNIGLFGLFLG